MKKYSPFVIVGLLLGLLLGSVTVDAQEERMTSNGRFTLGSRMAEDYLESTADMLIPIYVKGQSLWFVNPRATIGDDSQEEVNFGLGYRYLMPDSKVILGANAYYDSHWSSHGNRFDQMGIGAEMLTKWVDARFNYYLPESKEADIGSGPAVWGEPYAEGNGIFQEYWGLAEKARDGFDAEVGVKLPKLDKWADVRAFVGYYDFESQFSGSSELDGFKGRIEIRPWQAMTFDAEIYEDDAVLDTDYYVGMRVQVPFNLGNIFAGENPFEGAAAMFSRKPESNFSTRMTEQVIRDQYIQLDSGVSDSAQKTALLENVMFADNVNGGSDGSAENPYLTIQDAVDAADSSDMENVFVQATGTTYTENVSLTDGINLWGAVPAQGGKTYGSSNSTSQPTVDGDSQGPALTLADGAGIHGIHIINSGTGSGVTTDPVFGYDTTRLGIYGGNVTDIVISNNWIENTDTGIGLVTDSVDNLNIQISDNTVERNDDGGLAIEARGDTGYTFNADISGTFNTNAGDGVAIAVEDFDTARLNMNDLSASYNSDSGLDVGLNPNGSSFITMDNVTADSNAEYGAVGLVAYSDGTGADAGISIADSSFSSNGYAGVDDLYVSADDGAASISLDNVTADSNADEGMDAVLADAYGVDGDATISVTGSSFSNNADDGIDEMEAFAYGDGGNAGISIADTTINSNDDYSINDLFAQAEGDGGDASIDIRNLTVRYNEYELDQTIVYAADGAASITIDQTDISNNFSYGMDYIYSDAYGENDDAVITITNSTYNDNEDDGIWRARSQAFGDGGDAIINMDNVTASRNRDEGLQDIEADARGAGGNAMVTLSNIVANENEYDGIEDLDVTADDGHATLTLTNIETIHNLDQGIYGIDVTANGDGHHASITIDNLTANYNDGDGIDGIDAAATGAGGNASIALSNIEASYNQDAGIGGIDAQADSGAATITLDTVMANNNDYNGLYNGIEADAYAGDAVISLSNITTNSNADEGIEDIVATAYGDGDDAIVSLSNVTAQYNEYDGIEDILAEAGGAGGNASITLDNVTASNNLDYGIDTVYADAADGGADISLNNVTANANVDDGIGFIAADANDGGDAAVSLSSITASNNQDDGISSISVGSNDGNATVEADDITAKYNMNDGIGEIGVFAADGIGEMEVFASDISDDGIEAAVSFTNSTVVGNHGVGAYLYAASLNSASSSIFGEGNTITDNSGEHGLRVEAESAGGDYDVDFGGGSQDSEGQNSLYNNGGFDFVNSGSGTAFIQESWWGQDGDPESNGQTDGTVDASDWLAAEPQ